MSWIMLYYYYMLADDKIIQQFLKKTGGFKNKINSIYLFGSRARGDEKPYSDYDMLLVMPKRDERVVDRLYDEVVNILLKTGKVISLKIFKKDDFERLAAIPTPFMEKVLREGVKIG